MKPGKDYSTTYMKVAEAYALNSYALRKQVGACIVTASGTILPGYNGTPSGTDNACEYVTESGLVTKPTVIHAELNCILKAAKEGVSIEGAVLYVTYSPCLPCAAMVKQAGIKKVFYTEQYRDNSGVQFLLDNGITVVQLQLN